MSRNDTHTNAGLLTSDAQLRELANLDPVNSLATMSDEELAAQARHLLPDMAGELLAHRLAERASRSPKMAAHPGALATVFGRCAKALAG
jgi:hypothetical protein